MIENEWKVVAALKKKGIEWIKFVDINEEKKKKKRKMFQ